MSEEVKHDRALTPMETRFEVEKAWRKGQMNFGQTQLEIAKTLAPYVQSFLFEHGLSNHYLIDMAFRHYLDPNHNINSDLCDFCVLEEQEDGRT